MSGATTLAAGSIPDALREHDQWVCWTTTRREGKATKIPIVPGTDEYASSTDSDTWRDLETALAHAETGEVDGVGFVFTEDDDLVGVDLDDCRDPETGEPTDVARTLIRQLGSYTEVSPSGTGYHVLVEGTLPDGRNRRGGLELYDNARFFTVTGDHVPGMPTRVVPRQEALVGIHREYLQDTTGADTPNGDRADAEQSWTPTSVSLSDDELLAKARNASNGAKFERLWAGNTVGYDSHSEADMALCCLLAFWTGGECGQMDRLFRQSNLYRGKWDDVHYADGATYGERTIERAIATTSQSYEPNRGDTSPRRGSDRVAGESVSPPFHNNENIIHQTEQNRQLRSRITELEMSVKRKSERIEQLEMKLQSQHPAQQSN